MHPKLIFRRSKRPSKFRNKGFIHIMHSLEIQAPNSFRKENGIPRFRHARVSIPVFIPPKFLKWGIQFETRGFRKQESRHVVRENSLSNSINENGSTSLWKDFSLPSVSLELIIYGNKLIEGNGFRLGLTEGKAKMLSVVRTFRIYFILI